MSFEIYHRPFGIMQQIIATNNFDGTLPSAPPTYANDMFTYAAEAAGGLFDPWSTGADISYRDCRNAPLRVIGIEINLSGDQSTWKIEKTDAAANVTLLWDKYDDEYFFASIDEEIILLPGETIAVTTTGTPTNAMKATVHFDMYRG